AHPGLVVQMRAGRASGRADPADDLAGLDRLADTHVDRRQMAVARRQSVAMVDIDRPAVAAAPARRRHRAVGGGAPGVADLPVPAEPGMHGGRAGERVRAHAEARCGIDVAVDRLAHGNAAERVRESMDLGAREADAVELPLEAAPVLRQARRNEWSAGAARAVVRGRLAEIDAEIG